MEAPLEQTEHGLVVKGPGWFVVNARETRWYRTGDARISNFAGDTRFEQLGVGIEVLGPEELAGIGRATRPDHDGLATPIGFAVRHLEEGELLTVEYGGWLG